MQHIALRLLTEWLKRDSGGVDDKLKGILSTGSNPTLDSEDDAHPLEVGFIGSEADDEVVAEFRDPPDLPALYVSEDGQMGMAGETFTDTHRDTLSGEGLPVAIRILQQNDDTVAAVVRRMKDLGVLSSAIGNAMEMAPPLITERETLDHVTEVTVQAIGDIARARSFAS